MTILKRIIVALVKCESEKRFAEKVKKPRFLNSLYKSCTLKLCNCYKKELLHQGSASASSELRMVLVHVWMRRKRFCSE